MIIDIDIDRLPSDADLIPIVDWCEKHIGPIGKKWRGHYDETDRRSTQCRRGCPLQPQPAAAARPCSA